MSSIVFLAPDEAMSRAATAAVRSLGLSIPVIMATDQGGLSELRRYPNARVLITRGGTSRMLEGLKGRTVVSIKASFLDIARALRDLAARGCRSIAVVAHERLIGIAGGDLETTSALGVTLCPCADAEAIASRVRELVAAGCDGVVGDTAAVEAARALGVPERFLDSDPLTIKAAILDALAVERGFEEQELMLKRFDSLLSLVNDAVAIFGSERELLFCNERARALLGSLPTARWYPTLQEVAYPVHQAFRLWTFGQHRYLVRSVELAEGERRNLVVVLRRERQDLLDREGGTSASRGLVAKTSFSDLIYRDKGMEEAVELGRRFADSDSTVMIFGETGTGKEGFAQSLHNASPRRQGPFVSVNCASLPQGIVASELFGYAEGAFTGARRNGKKGLFELAQGGTIFLDEITEMPLEAQSLFLRVIQEREVMRVGDDRVIPLDIRIICATNRRIEPLCAQGRFRLDLFYRLNVLRLRLPPLRSRPVDILPLFTHYVAQRLGISPLDVTVDEEARAALLGSPWPGNVRELRNVAEAVSFWGRHVTLERLLKIMSGDPGEGQAATLTLEVPPGASLREVEAAYLRDLLSRHSPAQAAAISGLSRTTLWRRARELGLGGAP
ncbi:MAG: sigma 54-interacting transcriptional regulator [Succinivibrionaceae bacterium]|nr:sigma 54-interacting transcriptional regulator [Succinivibrionaceae bacterium]